MASKDDELGFTDSLGNEVEFSISASKMLREKDSGRWDSFLNDSKIKKAISIEKDINRPSSETKLIKAALFEVRIAYALSQLNLPIQYEYSTNMGNTKVDFMLSNTNKWLIELTSLREGEEVKKATHKQGDTYSFLSMSEPDKNSPEVVDIIRAQRALCSKVSDKNGNPIKFPECMSNQYHMIIIDMRSFSWGDPDVWDFVNIAYGSKCLLDVDQGFLCRAWLENNRREWVKGVFEKNHPEEKCKFIRERIHAVGFIAEKVYNEQEFLKELKIFWNPHLFDSKETFRSILPYGLKNCDVI
ncbi:MAG: hypothetical protein K2X50_04805 [Gammaproteobacteria bacterium]|nr:hypothetical protein [Gammaproteobacteria bacterium]